MIKPISPDEVVEPKKEIPDAVIEVFNELIAKYFRDGKAEVLQKYALSAIAIKMHTSKDKCLSNRWLEVEEIFAEAGWNVKYLPAPNFAKEDTYVFTKKG